MGQRVLVVADASTVGDVVRRHLERAGFGVALAGDGRAAMAAFEQRRPSLVVLDVILPGMDGLALCRRMRARDGDVPVLMLTASGEEADRVVGLEIGADYVTKPFSPRELMLRVRSLLRRAAPQQTRLVLRDDDLLVDVARRVARRGDHELALTVREFDLLAYLLRHPGRAFRRSELLDAVWGWTFGDHSTVTVHVRRLREKIEADPAQPQRIVTVWGVGYRYEPATAARTVA